MGIYSALKEHKGKVSSKIIKGVSAGSIIPLAADPGEVKMMLGGIYMMHNPWTIAIGEAKDMLKTADILNEVKEAIMNIYEQKTKRPREELYTLMDEESWMSAKKAVAEGFADSILYAEEAEPVMDYMISRLAIQNSARKTMQRFLEIQQLQQSDPPADPPPEDPPDPPAEPKEDGQAKSLLSLLAMKVQINKNRRL